MISPEYVIVKSRKVEAAEEEEEESVDEYVELYKKLTTTYLYDPGFTLDDVTLFDIFGCDT